MITVVRRLGLRFLVMLGGEALQSAFAFGLNIGLARSLPAERYGLFAIIILIGGFGIIYMRALIGIPACTYIPQSRRQVTARFYAVMFGSGALAVSVTGSIAVAATLAFWYPAGAVAAGFFVGTWALRSYIRMALFAQRRVDLATLCDLVFTLAATIFCIPVFAAGDIESMLPNVLLVLGVAHLTGIGLALMALGQPVRLSFRRALRRRLGHLLPTMSWSIISVTMANIQGQGAILLLALLAGPAAYAPIAATMAFFSPLRLAASALINLTQPDLAAKLARPHSRQVMELLLASTGMMIGVCAAYGLAMWLVFPTLAARAFAHRFGDAPLDLIAINIWSISTVAVFYSVPRALLEAARQFVSLTFLSACGALVSFPLVFLLLYATTSAWSLFGILLSELLILVGSWIIVVKFLQGRKNVGSDRRSKAADRRQSDTVARFESSSLRNFGVLT